MMSNYMRTAVLNALRGTSFSVSQLYLGLFIQPPTAAGGEWNRTTVVMSGRPSLSAHPGRKEMLR